MNRKNLLTLLTGLAAWIMPPAALAGTPASMTGNGAESLYEETAVQSAVPAAAPAELAAEALTLETTAAAYRAAAESGQPATTSAASWQVQQQTMEVTGSVTDAEGQPLVGIGVIVVGTTIGTFTDAEGLFSLRIPTSGILQFSSIGFLTYEVPISVGRTVYDVTLHEDSEMLDATIVVGYGIQKKSDVTGSVGYGDLMSSAFRIAADVWTEGVWQREIEYFLPIQMCHVRVNEKYRVWHGRCHTDDARMAPTDINHIDGYVQGPSTLCGYSSGEQVNGLAVGGWHDAGDYDLRVESQAGEAYILAQMWENYGAYWDETAIDFENRVVEIHQPDGRNDVLQQVENGALSIVAGWKALGRLYRGIICPTVRQYVHLGDASTHTDLLSGTEDDRCVFTEENPVRELQTAAHLAGISRALRGFNDGLAADCLEIAVALYSGTAADAPWAVPVKLHAAVELYLATGEAAYRDYVLASEAYIRKNILRVGWFLGRFDKAVNDSGFHAMMLSVLPQLRAQYEAYASKTPYGVPDDMGNRSSGSWEPQGLGFQYAYLHAAYPEIFAPDYVFSCVQYLLGLHPGSKAVSFVTGTGAKTMTAAYGVNRADWSYVPGGVAPGVNLIRPDLPELLDFPFLWQEGEYCLGGHTTWFSYMVLASDRILNGR